MLVRANLDDLAKTQGETEKYLDRHDVLKRRLDNLHWAFQDLCDLVPQPWGKLFSGHIFPVTQARDELRNCAALAHIGFYQHAIAGLRWVLELGMLSVYWDRADDAERVIQEWLRSRAKTPFRRHVLKGLKGIPNVARYCERSAFIDEFERVYEELSKYQHVRGVRYSSRHLSHGNVIRFQAVAFERWAALTSEVVPLVTTAHLLKYPVGLQYTPVEQKFGFLDGPMGGFLNPWQVDRLRSLFDADEIATLQAVSDADPDARALAEEFANMPDITEEELAGQVVRADQSAIENQGFQSWYEGELRVRRQLAIHGVTTDKHEDDQEFQSRVTHLRTWAAERGWLEFGRHGPPRKQENPHGQQPAREWMYVVPPRDQE